MVQAGWHSAPCVRTGERIARSYATAVQSSRLGRVAPEDVMRLLWLTHFVPYPPIGHGALQRTHHLLKEACKQHEIHVVALSPPSPFISSRTMPQAVAALSAMATSIEVFPVADLHGARR